MAKPNQPKAPEICPVCGEDVPRGSLACPECGADHNSGWREDADIYDAVDLPDEEFNYDDFVRQEFGAPAKQSSRRGATMGVSIAIGIGIGAAVGAAMQNVAMGVAFGTAFGVALGALLTFKKTRND
jgi:hypothetical protein